MELGFIKNLQVTTLIILHSLHHLLHFSALSLLLLYLVKALVSPLSCISSHSTLSMLFLLYLLHNFKYLASHSYPTLDPILAPPVCRDVFFKVCFALNIMSFTINLNYDYTPPTIAKLCRNFAIVFVVGLMGGTMYTALTLSRWADCGEIIEERSRWMIVMIRWSMNLLKACRWIAGGASLLSFIDFILPYSTLAPQISARYAVPCAIWIWAATGLSVGMVSLMFLCAISTQAALYLACRTHHKQSEWEPLISKDVPPSGHV